MRLSLRLSLRMAAWLGLSFACAACVPNPYYDPYKPHHLKHGFRNVHVTERMKKRGLMYWLLHELTTEDEPFSPPTAAPDMERILRPDPDVAQLTWIGHSTFLIQYRGINVLTDPMFSKRASPFPFLGPKRLAPPAVALRDLPPIDIVLVSHNHYDHLDSATVRALGNGPKYYVPLGLKGWFATRGVTNVTEQDWQDTDKPVLRNGTSACVTFLPAQHFSRRAPWDGNRTLWGSWTVKIGDLRFFFAGDTGYMPEFPAVGARCGKADVALVPIGAYEPRSVLKNVHVTPEEAVRTAQDMGAERLLPMHWATFRLTTEPMEAPLRRFRAAATLAGYAETDAPGLRIGDTYRFVPSKKAPGCKR
jgi:N-acyl-phosphatidylethanolamine-hydrolysing phospholipase D